MSIQVNLKKFKATHGTPAHPEHNLSASPNTWKPVTEEMWAPSIRAFPNPGGQHMPLFFTKTMIFGMLQINKNFFATFSEHRHQLLYATDPPLVYFLNGFQQVVY